MDDQDEAVRAVLDQLRNFDTPTICNALELIDPATRGHGYTRLPVFCAFPDLRPVVGFAKTAKIKAAEPSSDSAEALRERRLAYYRHVADRPTPSVVVIQDLDDQPGLGAFWGEVHSAVHRGLGLEGCLTDGGVRDLDALDPRFQILAGRVTPTHAFVRVEEVATPVTVFGLEVRPNDLIHADRHGAALIPRDALSQLPNAIDLMQRRERPLIEAARSDHFSLEKLEAAIREADEIH